MTQPMNFADIVEKASQFECKNWQSVGRESFQIDETAALFDPERADEDPKAVADHLMRLLYGFGGMLRLANSVISQHHPDLPSLKVLVYTDSQNPNAPILSETRVERCVRLLGAFMVSEFGKSLPEQRERLFSKVLVDMILALLKFGCHTFDLAHDCVELKTEIQMYSIESSMTEAANEPLGEPYVTNWFADIRTGNFYSAPQVVINAARRKDITNGMKLLQKRLQGDRTFCANFGGVLKVMSKELNGYRMEDIVRATTEKIFVRKPDETLDSICLGDLWYLGDLAKLSDGEVPFWKAGAR